ncbi:hypothetical protein [Streptomyces osmaniensis]|uniref:hypothetical protein n=1 Tax=Streptomyces osmaniensis TaxID=593134 RepID=UPI003D15CC32
MPAGRAVERDEEAVCGWVKETWPQAEAPRWHTGHGSSSGTSRLLDDAADRPYLGPPRAHAPHPCKHGRPKERVIPRTPHSHTYDEGPCRRWKSIASG